MPNTGHGFGMLHIAEQLRGVRVIVLPSDGKEGTNPLDLGDLLRKFQVK